MHFTSAFAIAATATGLLFGAPHAVADTGGFAPHENTYSTSDGLTYTVGHSDYTIRPIAPLNNMPTNREAFLDGSFYGRVAGGTGKLKAGYFVACAVDIDVVFSADASASLGLGADAGVSVSPDAVSPSVDATLGPSISAGIGLDLSIAPGEIKEVVIGEKDLAPDLTGTIVSHDFRLSAHHCGGPLTIRPYSMITATSPTTDASGAVFGDPAVI
ncbi:MspA family porin [Nocardia sp. alder85J]|uniref:MspA family porin n=1 Tax=Nocardia sp. alder85J TaxID=2862949 RepID=UPI001CD8139B|nr:MspA family porin [Nocardia sp. alder85J]MCX4097200.1 MspA family porin [Nocardia sp. alder85J]